MPDYVCLIYDKNDKVLTVEDFNANDDDAAIDKATALTRANVGCRGYELWQGGKKIATNLPKRRSSG